MSIPLQTLRSMYPDAPKDRLPADWDKRRVSIDEAEAEHLVTDERLGPEPVPFGFQNKLWKDLLALMVEGDELWLYRSPPETWARLCGREGIALVRDGELIERIDTLIN